MKHKVAAWLRALLSIGLLAALLYLGGLISLPAGDPASASPALVGVPADPQIFLPAVFRPAEPTPAPPPTPPPAGTIQVFDAAGVERDLAWLQDKYGDFLIQAAADGDGPVYRIATLRERVDTDTIMRVRILDENGAALAGVPVAWYWPDAPADPACGPLGGVLPGMVAGRCEHAATGLDGLTHFYMGDGARYSPDLGEIGPHAVWVYGATTRSDLILGLGMVDGTNNDHFDVDYRQESGEVVPPTPVPPPSSSCAGTWDPRLDELGVYLEPAGVQQAYWCLYEARWADPVEADGLHHIFLEAIDAGGNRVLGQEVVVEWSTGSVTLIIEDKPPPEYGANFPMYATLGSYSARAGGGQPSDRIVGMGLGTPEQPDFTIHTAFYLTFKWVP